MPPGDLQTIMVVRDHRPCHRIESSYPCSETGDKPRQVRGGMAASTQQREVGIKRKVQLVRQALLAGPLRVAETVMDRYYRVDLPIALVWQALRQSVFVLRSPRWMDIVVKSCKLPRVDAGGLQFANRTAN